MDFVGLDRRKGAEGRQIQNKLVSIINQFAKIDFANYVYLCGRKHRIVCLQTKTP